MIKWIVILCISAILWIITDVRSGNIFQSVLVPLALVIIWLSTFVSVGFKSGLLKGKVIPGGKSDSGSSASFLGGDSGGGSGGGDCGGDGGGGC